MDSICVALKSLQDNSPQYIQYILAIIALLSVIVGPYVSYRIALRTVKSQTEITERQIATQINLAEYEIKAKVLSGNRQEWINTLRNTISEYQSIIHSIAMIIITANMEGVKIGQDYFAQSKEASLRKYKIRLLINSTEEDHKKIIEIIDKIDKEVLYNQSHNITLINSLQIDLTEISQKVLKREWERVKQVE